MKGLYSINGYFTDDKTEFENYLVYEYDDVLEIDDQIFFYGLSEREIIQAIKTEAAINGTFVITSYKKEWKEKTAWDFVEEHYPNYSSCDMIARLNDLDKLVDEEFEEGDSADQLLQRDYGGEIPNFEISIDQTKTELLIYKKAIENFQSKQQTNI
jgi:hypothetical protein